MSPFEPSLPLRVALPTAAMPRFRRLRKTRRVSLTGHPLSLADGDWAIASDGHRPFGRLGRMALTGQELPVERRAALLEQVQVLGPTRQRTKLVGNLYTPLPCQHSCCRIRACFNSLHRKHESCSLSCRIIRNQVICKDPRQGRRAGARLQIEPLGWEIGTDCN